MFLLGCIILSIQLADGAYSSEFTLQPDEPGQFVSGLMIFDYFRLHPSGNPVDWAVRYYLHYPRVAIGRWPPGFALAEAAWWSLFGVSHWSVIVLLGLITWISAVIFHRLASRLVRPSLAVFGTLCLVASPWVISSFSTVMADAPGLLISVLIINDTAAWIVRPQKSTLFRIFCVLCAGLLIKGTALCLVPVPVLAFVFAGKARWLWRRATAVVLGIGAAATVALYFAYRSAVVYIVTAVAGVRSDIPWPAPMVFTLAGYALCVFAILGLYFAFRYRQPITLAAAATVLSTLAVSFLMRAMQEPRHWLVILPGTLLLALEFMSRVAGRSDWKLALAAAVATATFPFHINLQHSEGFNAFVSQIPLPSRVMISSSQDGEGPLLAALALRDKRISSVIVRANKTLASEDWNGEQYHLLAADAQQAALLLDELRIQTVILHSPHGLKDAPHHVLLRKTLASSDSWQEFAHTGVFEAWRRVKAATVPEKPLQIDLRNRIGRIIRE